jgi:hypothetical protein
VRFAIVSDEVMVPAQWDNALLVAEKEPNPEGTGE